MLIVDNLIKTAITLGKNINKKRLARVRKECDEALSDIINRTYVGLESSAVIDEVFTSLVEAILTLVHANISKEHQDEVVSLLCKEMLKRWAVPRKDKNKSD